MKWFKRIGMFLGVLLAGPLLMVACGKINLGQDWRTADRSPTGIAPDPDTTREAVVQVQEEDDRRDKKRERGGNQHQEDRSRHEGDDDHGRRQRVEHRHPVDVVFRRPGATMRVGESVGRDPG